MKFVPLIWKGIWRKRGRAILILLQIVVAFTLFGLLQGLNGAVKQAIASTHADRLYVVGRSAMGEPLPLAYLEQIRGVPGVRDVNYRLQFGGQYQRPGQGVVIAATDVESFFRVFSEVSTSRESIDALRATPSGAIVGRVTAEEYGWKVGDRFTIQTPIPRTDGSREFTFDIVGIFENTDRPEQSIGAIANYAYINEARARNRNTVMLYTALIDDPAKSAEIGFAIDSLFENSTNETRTQTESQIAQSQIDRIGNLDYIAHAITGAAFFALLFATGALMMQSIRERTPELAVLKTVGFTDRLVMTLILAEVLLLALIGAAIGLWLGDFMLSMTRQMIGVTGMPASIVVAGFVCAVLLALASGAIPAWRGLRLQVAQALSGR